MLKKFGPWFIVNSLFENVQDFLDIQYVDNLYTLKIMQVLNVHDVMPSIHIKLTVGKWTRLLGHTVRL